MGNWNMRRAESRDAIALSACIEAAYAQYATRVTDLPPVAANCAEEIVKYPVWVAEIDDDIVGGVVTIPAEDFMLLANVAVHPRHAGSGLGKALIALVETEALRRGCRELRLTTHLDMPENIQLYAHLGWVERGREGNKVSMTKTL